VRCHPGEQTGSKSLTLVPGQQGFPTPRAALEAVLRTYPDLKTEMFTEGNGSDHAVGPVIYEARGNKGEVRMVVVADQITAPDAAGQHWLGEETVCNDFANGGVR